MQNIQEFIDLGLSPESIRAIQEKGFEKPTEIQRRCIPTLLKGHGDLIGQAQTGTGKTAAFALPLIEMISSLDANGRDSKPKALVLVPTRELCMQVCEEIKSLSYKRTVITAAIYGGASYNIQFRDLKAGVDIVVGTPGRVQDHLERKTLSLENIKVCVLDEADEMLDMGFREDIETILQGMPTERQTALFSATMPKPILEITKKYQKEDAKFIKMTPKEITVAAIEQAYYRVPQKMKEEVLTRLMDYYNPARSLIFCNTKRMVDQLSESLKGKGYLCDGLHGDLSQNQRDTVMNLFRSGRINILIATDVAARGIDVSGVEAVFNFDIPEDIEYYVHRIGRTGRAGKSGKSFTLVGGREMYKLREIEKICHTTIEERKVPGAKEITRVKSQKVFAEVIDIIENGDITQVLEYVNSKVEEGEYTAEQLAAGFMKLKMGADIQDLVLFEKKESKRDRYRRTGERLTRRESDGKRRGRSDDDRKSSRGRRSDKKDRFEKTEKRFDKKSDKKSVAGKSVRKSERRLDKRAEKPVENKLDIGDLNELKDIYRKKESKSPDKTRKTSADRPARKRSSDAFENVGRINIKGEGSTKAWYVGQDEDTMNISKSKKKSVKAQNKKRSLDYLQDMSDLVMESFGKRKNRENGEKK